MKVGWLIGLLALSLWLQFSASVTLIEVYATVVDEQGRFVTDLTADDFEVLERGRRQTVSTFARGEFPLTVALALDRSWSMAGRPLALVRSAAHAFLGQLREGDQALLLAVGSGVEEAAPLGTDRARQHLAVSQLAPWGTTNLHDVVIAAVDRVQQGKGRRALVLLSDGVDRYSEATETMALDHARRHDVLVYPVALAPRVPAFFAALAAQSGGRALSTRDPAGLRAQLETVIRELRAQYLLGYTPEPTGGGREWRPISVRVPARPGLTVRARPGYWPVETVQQHEAGLASRLGPRAADDGTGFAVASVVRASSQ